MWPAQSTQGPRLSYGHDGALLYRPEGSPDAPFQFARRRGLGHRFHVVAGAYTLSERPRGWEVPKYAATVRDTDKQTMFDSVPQQFIPAGLVNDLKLESFNVSSAYGHDPLAGSLLTSGLIPRSGGDHGEEEDDDEEEEDEDEEDDEEEEEGSSALAFAGGAGGTFVNLALLKSRAHLAGETELELPILRGESSCDFESPVRQVEFADPEPSVAPHILVRTETGTCIASVRASAQTSISPQFSIGLHSFNSESLENSYDSLVHADATFSPWSWSQMAIITTQGTWGLWDVTRGDAPATASSILDRYTQTASRWNNISWGADINSLLACNRRFMNLYDIRKPNKPSLTTSLYSERDQTEIFGLARVPSNDHDVMLLLNNGVRWLDLRKPQSPILTWDHFLHSKDSSVFMDLTTTDDITMVSVHSHTSPLSIVYQFCEADGMFVSADDPYSYLTAPGIVTQSALTLPIEPNESKFSEEADPLFKASIQLSSDYGLYCNVLSSDDKIRVVDLTAPRGNPLGGEYVGHEDDVLDCSYDKDMRSDYDLSRREHWPAVWLDLRAVYSYAFDVDKHVPAYTDDEDDYLQGVALNLGAKINDLFASKQRKVTFLSELAPQARLCRNLGEFDEMLQQLMEQYKDTTIHVSNVCNGTSLLLDNSLVQDLSDMHNHLVSIWVEPILGRGLPEEVVKRREKLCFHIAVDLTLSSIAVHGEYEDTEDTEEVLADMVKFITVRELSLKENTKQLLSEWTLATDPDSYEWRPLGSSHPESPPQTRRRQMRPSQANQASQSTQLSPVSKRSRRSATPAQMSDSQSSQGAWSQRASQASQRYSQPRPSQRSLRTQRRAKKRADGFG